jgi:hypothetical protein
MIAKRKTALLLAVSALGMSGAAAFAQDAQTQTELDALRARVEALEAANPGAGTGDLRIGNTTLDVYGYVKADFFYDTDFELGDLADATRIGEPANATSGTFGATVRQSRIGLRTNTPSAIGDIAGQLELDLFSGGTDGPAELRLRHANIRIGDNWLIGQFWTNFQPLDTYPTTVEFNGPVGIPFARVPQVRYTNTLGSDTTFAVAIEENVGGSDSNDPVLTGSIEYNNGTYLARASALYGKAQSGAVEVDQTGYTLSAGIRPWQGGLFQVNYVDGEALGPYLIAAGDAIVNGQANDVDGFTVEFRQELSPKWNVGIAYGQENYDLPTSTGTLSFTEVETIHVNAFYKATDNLTLSAEYFYGERNDAPTGRTFDSNRIQLAAQLNF